MYKFLPYDNLVKGREKTIKFNERQYAFTDVETTGLDFRVHEIVEIGLVVVSPDTLDVVKTFEAKVKPERIETASKKALEINGYNEADWVSALSLKAAMKLYAEISKDAVFCAHNVTFDWGFIDEAFKKTGVKDLMDYHRKDLFTIAHEKLMNSGLEKFNLIELCSFLGIDPEPPVHRAINGTMKALEVYRKLRSL